MTHHVMEARSGRAIGVSGLGDPDSERLVVFCHPSPGASGFDPDPDLTTASGLRLMSLDRPGYGATDPAPAAHGGVWLDDVSELLDIVEQSARSATGTDYGAIAVIGWGVGSVYAAALAALRPHLVDRLALVAPPAPGADASDEALLSADVDEDAHPGFLDRRDRMLASAANGVGGRDFDRAVLESAWSSRLSAIRADVLIVTTDDDSGREAARQWRELLPGAALRASDGSAAGLIADTWGDVLAYCRVREPR
ncbi:alpha/beta fold hydrolase [Pseudolysinimonas sp.]|uniref:alpha/beta fold hydrolase n=1 Tax=Pseudolysinimonas sp. TaxID=2680009 RepID=UPI003F8046B6